MSTESYPSSPVSTFPPAHVFLKQAFEELANSKEGKRNDQLRDSCALALRTSNPLGYQLLIFL